MSTVFAQGPKLSCFLAIGTTNHRDVRRTASATSDISWTMSTEPMKSTQVKKETRDHLKQKPLLPSSRFSGHKIFGLQFDQLKPPEEDLVQQNRHEFGQFMAREALLDEEYWTAAWLRAESLWEDRPNERYVENYKRKFAEQEYSAIKRRICRTKSEQKCSCWCIVMIENCHGNDEHAVLRTVVGTLDLAIQYLLPGETFPGEKVRSPSFYCFSIAETSRYGYISNLCVAKSARRQGIGSKMLNFAIASAKSAGVEVVYVHVHRDNNAAQWMYEKIGFQVVKEATSQLTEEQTYLLCKSI